MTSSSSSPPTPIDWQNLIQVGRDLLNPQPTGDPPTNEHIRRAISNAYYALFHALSQANASALIGTPTDAASASAWSRVYRALDHGTARLELQRHRRELSPPAQTFVDTFSDLQLLRHSADYDHTAVLTSHQASIRLQQAQTATLDYLQVDANERAYIATLLLARSR